MKNYMLQVEFKAKDGHGERLALILLRAAEILSSFEGCLLYLVGKSETEPDGVWVTELWKSQEAHAESLKLPEVRELIAQAIPIIEGQPKKGKELEILGGKGI